MKMKSTDFLAASMLAVLGLVPGQIKADTIELDAEIECASVHAGGVDMAVYYQNRGDHFEVVGTYAPAEPPFRPARIRMGLADGDSVSFGLPGIATAVLYTFEREGETVRVDTTHVGAEFAQFAE